MLDAHATAYIENIMETMNDIEQTIPFLVDYDMPNAFPLSPPTLEPLPYHKELFVTIIPWYAERGIRSQIVGSSLLVNLTRLDIEELIEDTRVVSIRKLSPKLLDKIASVLFA